MKNFKAITLWGILLSLSFYSCTDDYFEFDNVSVKDWNPELAAPLINSSLSLEDIVISKDSLGIVNQNSEGLLQVVYKGRVYTDLGVSGLVLSDASFNEVLSGISLPTSGSFSSNLDYTYNYNTPNNVEIDSTLLKAGILLLKVESDFQHNIDFVIRFNSITDANGLILERTLNIPAANGSNTVERAFNVDLNGYSIDFTNGGTTINTIPYETEITFNIIEGNPSSTSDELKFTTEIRNPNYKDFYGYIGQSPFDLRKDTILINIFKNFETGNFFLSNPSLNINITNSFGIPMSMQFDQLEAITDMQTTTVLNNGIPLENIPLNSPPTIFGAAETDLTLVNTNSNIAPIVSSLVKEIAFDSRALINPQGNDGTRNFLSDTSRIGLGIDLTMPFEGYVVGFKLIDTVEAKLESFEEFEKGILRIICKNSFPIEAGVQLLFLDENYAILDSLYPNGSRVIIPSGIINETGKTIQRGEILLDTEVDRQKLLRISETNHIAIVASLNTPTLPGNVPDTVKFFPEYRLDIKLGVKATININ